MFYYFFVVVVVFIRCETTATARWALLFIIRALFRGHHHRCSLGRFSCAPHGEAPLWWQFYSFADPILASGLRGWYLVRHRGAQGHTGPRITACTADSSAEAVPD